MDIDTDIDTRYLAPTVTKLLGVAPPDECEVESIPQVVQALASRVRIGLIILDALGIASLNTHRDQAPFVMELISANFLPMRSVFPTVTPVNFASMATGVSPARHSIRDRNETIIYDTLFDTLKRGRRKTAVAAREASTLNLLLADKADYQGIASSNHDTDVVHEAELILEEEEPDFFWVQLLDMDDAQHTYGVSSPAAGTALGRLDRNLKHLCELFQELEYGLIITADHGQHDKGDNSGGTHDGTVPDDVAVPLTWIV